MPAVRPPYLDRPFAALAHRGGWLRSDGTGPENTRRAFAHAVELGYEYLETDVRTTADGVLVAFHDRSLDRVTNGTGPVAERTWAELSGLVVDGTEPIARMADLLEEFGTCRFNIDLKDARSVAPLAELVRRHGAQRRVCVGSFSTSRLAAFRRLAGQEVVTSVSPAGVAWYGFAPLLRRLPLDSGAVLQVPARVLRERVALVRRDVVDAAHAAGRLVHVWTIDAEAEMERLLELGVDGLVTNNVEALKQVLSRHGLWEDHR